MDLVSILIGLVILAAIVWFAFWIIDSAFPAPINMPAKVIVGLIALLVLLEHTGFLANVRV